MNLDATGLKISRLNLSENDILIIKVSQPLPHEAMERIYIGTRQALDEAGLSNFIMVMPEGFSVTAMPEEAMNEHGWFRKKKGRLF